MLLLVGFDYNAKKASGGHMPKDRPLTQQESELLDQMIKNLNKILKEIAQKYPHVLFFNLNGKIKRDFFKDDCHLNEAGKKLKASLIGTFILDHKNELGLGKVSSKE